MKHKRVKKTDYPCPESEFCKNLRKCINEDPKLRGLEKSILLAYDKAVIATYPIIYSDEPFK